MEECMSMLRTVPLLALLTMALSGCTYVSPTVYNDHIACLDEDGDTFVKQAACPDLAAGEEADCDDSNADRYPGNPEKPYDGIDQDCDGEDLVDIDGDRYPGIIEADWEPQHGNLSWPEGLFDNCDCDDEASTTFPTSGANVPYDGVDSACEGYMDSGGNYRCGIGAGVDDENSPCQYSDCGPDPATDWDDWDADDDNHVPYAALFTGAEYTGDLPEDDCDDSDAAIHPGATDVLWYDGIDNDCDGTNDFDQDGDGYIRDIDITEYLAFLDRYKYSDDRACTLTDGSCNDCDDEGGQDVAPELIHPDATETWYDGVDQNCDEKNDYDQDEDGFECDGNVVGACSSHTTGDDCNDTVSAINPLALELLTDGVDQDCESGNDGARFQLGPWTWIDPTNPAIIANDLDYIIGIAATQVDEDGTPDALYPGAILHLPLATPVPADEPRRRIIEDGQPISHGAAMYPDGSDFWFGTTWAATTFNRTRIHHAERSGSTYSTGLVNQFASSNTTQQPNTCDPGGTTPCPFDDFDLQQAATGEVWLVACSGYSGHFLQAELTSSVDLLGVQTFSGEVGHACWLDAFDVDSATLHAYTEDGGTYGYRQFSLFVDTVGSSHTFTEVTTPTHATSNYAVEDVKNHPDLDLVVLAGSDKSDCGSCATPHGVTLLDEGTPTAISALAGLRSWSADAAYVDGTWYVGAIVDLGTQDGVKEAVLLYGSNPASMTGPVTLALPNGEVPEEVALYADGDRVIMAVTGEGPLTDIIDGGEQASVADDVLGWAMWGYAP